MNLYMYKLKIWKKATTGKI